MMNMVSKSSSILMAIGIVAVAAVAIIGLGYAYTASTQNADNDAIAGYLLLTQTDYDHGFEDNKVAYNTSNPDGTNVTYTFAGTVESNGSAVSANQLKNAVETDKVYYHTAVTENEFGDKVYELGNSLFTLTSTQLGNIPAYSIKVETTGLETTYYKYYLTVNSGVDFYPLVNSTATVIPVASPGTTSDEITIHLYVASNANVVAALNSAVTTPLADTTFTVTAEVA